MRVLVCGSAPRRDRPGWEDRDLLFSSLDTLAATATTVVEGEAEGADRMAAEWAAERGIPVERHPAHWERYGRAAGPMRNREMLQPVPDMVVAFSRWEPPTSGTADMLAQAHRAGVPSIWVVYPGGRLTAYSPRPNQEVLL